MTWRRDKQSDGKLDTYTREQLAVFRIKRKIAEQEAIEHIARRFEKAAERSDEADSSE